MIQRHYNNETYFLQLDSHHRFETHWDTMLINMLHKCDAGEKSVLTYYPSDFVQADPKDGYSEVILKLDVLNAMRYYQFRWDSGMGVIGGRFIEFNLHELTAPYETPSVAGGFMFSHGHFVLNAGYVSDIDNIFLWEEPYQTYLAWKAGYKLYAPNEVACWHLWDRTYRPLYGIDDEKIKKTNAQR